MRRWLSRDDVLEMALKDTPMLVLSDGLYSWFSFRIKQHCRGEYNHAMWVVDPATRDHDLTLVSQDWVLHETPAEKYLAGNHRLKFWHNPAWDGVQISDIRDRAWRLLKRPWYRRAYDAVGIVGHALRIPWFNAPHLQYCSEFAGELLRMVEPAFTMLHPSPSDINAWCKRNSQMECWGVYDTDLE